MGLFSRNKGDAMSKKRRSTDSGDDSNLPDDTDANEPGGGPIDPPPDALRVANLQDTPPNDSQTEPVNSPVGTVPGTAAGGESRELTTRERLRSASREDKHALLVAHGGLTPEEAQALSEEDLDNLSVGLVEQLQREEQRKRAAPGDDATTAGAGGKPRDTTLGAPVATESAIEPLAMRVAALLRAKSREDKIALLAERTNLDVREAAALTPEDLDFHARAVLEQDAIAAEAAEKMRGADPNALVGDPYGDDKPQHYAVVEHVRPLLIDGGMVQLRAGQIITNRTHNIEELRKYGAQLVPCEPPEPYLQR